MNADMIGTVVSIDTLNRYLGMKHYEAANHLGNVLTTFTDKKIPIQSTTTPGTIDHYEADILNSTDYSAFGVELQGRRLVRPIDNVTTITIDRLLKAAAGTDPAEYLDVKIGNSVVHLCVFHGAYSTVSQYVTDIQNSLTAAGYTPTVTGNSISFGSSNAAEDEFNGGNFVSVQRPNQFRYGFNGKEKDDETFGEGDELDYADRIYDTRVGRFLSVDKLTKNFPWLTPYQFAGNTPIQAIDLDGKEIYYAQSGEQIGKYGSSTEVRVLNDDQVAQTRAEFAAHTENLKTDPNASSQFLSQTLLTTGSVKYADYFTTVGDVANTTSKDFKFHSYFDEDCNHNCKVGAEKQLNDAGQHQTGASDAMQAKISNGAQDAAGKPELTADAIGASIYVMTQLKRGHAVMVGVEVDFSNGGVGDPGGGFHNNNVLTSHFVTINSSTVTNGVVSFGYIDNTTHDKAKGVNEGNQFAVNKDTGNMKDSTNVITGSGQTPKSTAYQVTEVRKNQ
jgi:RHS repeat-associated protein